MTKNKDKILCFLIGAVIGAVFFIIMFGADIISPSNTHWIFAQHDDVTQHHVGWVFFRRSDWTFPIGLIDGISANEKVSCMFTDSLPLFAVFFKLLSPILPENFQYFGLWGVICYALNGGFGAVLLSRIKSDLVFTSIGSVFYSAFWPTLLRITHHNALGAIWLILAAMILTLDHEKKYKHSFTPVILWTALCVTAALIHLYFIPMIYCVMLGYMILLVFKDKKLKKAVITFISSTLFTVCAIWVIGGFYGSGSYSDGGFGVYSANFNAFFNSMGHAKYTRQLDSFSGQYEGFGYLGIGMLILCFLAVILIINRVSSKEGGFIKNTAAILKNRKIEVIAFAIVFAAGFLWAASNTITINKDVSFTIPLPYFVISKLGIFRSSGRIIWLPCLMTMTLTLWVCTKLNKKALLVSMIIAVLLQLGDMQNYYDDLRKGDERLSQYVTPLSGEKWDDLTEGAEEIVFLPLPPDYKSKMKLYFDFAELAVNKHMKLSSFYLARVDYSVLDAYADEKYNDLKNGRGRQDLLYVFFNSEDVPKNVRGLDVYELDEYTVARVKK